MTEDELKKVNDVEALIAEVQRLREMAHRTAALEIVAMALKDGRDRIPVKAIESVMAWMDYVDYNWHTDEVDADGLTVREWLDSEYGDEE